MNVPRIFKPYHGEVAPTAKVIARKQMAEHFVAQATEADKRNGRSDANFAVKPAKAFSQALIDSMLHRGIAVYVGAGNVFLADLAGNSVHVVQRRPLAQRTVRLLPQGFH